MRATTTKRSKTKKDSFARPKEWPSVEQLREKCDERFKARGTTRTEALRLENMSNTSFERHLREGLSKNPREFSTRKLSALGVLDLIPRR